MLINALKINLRRREKNILKTWVQVKKALFMFVDLFGLDRFEKDTLVSLIWNKASCWTMDIYAIQ